MSGPSLAKLCTLILKDTDFQYTPLQKEEFQKLVDADARGDEEYVKQMSERINQHFSKLNENLLISAVGLDCRRSVALKIVYCIANEYAPPETRTEKKFDWLIFSYGDVEHQLQSAQMREVEASEPELRLEAVTYARKYLEDISLDELCLDRDYARKRFRATCKDENLTNGLLHASDWDGLKALLDQDEEVCKKLIPWLLRVDNNNRSFLEAANNVVTSQVGHYRVIAEDRPDTAEPPPAYTVNDLNAPPDYPEQSSGWMSLIGFDQVMNRLRSTFIDPGTEREAD